MDRDFLRANTHGNRRRGTSKEFDYSDAVRSGNIISSFFEIEALFKIPGYYRTLQNDQNK